MSLEVLKNDVEILERTVKLLEDTLKQVKAGAPLHPDPYKAKLQRDREELSDTRARQAIRFYLTLFDDLVAVLAVIVGQKGLERLRGNEIFETQIYHLELTLDLIRESLEEEISHEEMFD